MAEAKSPLWHDLGVRWSCTWPLFEGVHWLLGLRGERVAKISGTADCCSAYGQLRL